VDRTIAEPTEVVVDFSRYPVGTRVVLRDLRADGASRRIMSFGVVRAAKDDSVIPVVLSEFELLRSEDTVRTRTFLFGGKPGWGIPTRVRWGINGKPFHPARVDAEPRLGDTEIWRFISRGFLGTMLHPVHTHLAPFQVLRRNGRDALLQERGWKDTVAIDDGEEVDVIIRWRGYRGRYLLHCHNLEHEDHAMMPRVDVI
jgi:spore coat protein A